MRVLYASCHWCWECPSSRCKCGFFRRIRCRLPSSDAIYLKHLVVWSVQFAHSRNTTSASRASRHLLVLPRPNGSKSISKSTAKALEETNTGCIGTNCELVQLLILNGCNAAMQCRLLTFSHLVEAIHPNRVWIVMIEESMLQQTSGGFLIDWQGPNPNTI